MTVSYVPCLLDSPDPQNLNPHILTQARDEILGLRKAVGQVRPTSYNLLPTPSRSTRRRRRHLTPSHSTSYTLHHTRYTLPYTRHPTPDTRHTTPYTLHPTPYTPHPTPYHPHPKPSTRKKGNDELEMGKTVTTLFPISSLHPITYTPNHHSQEPPFVPKSP